MARAPANFNVKRRRLGAIAVPRVTPGLPSELLYQRPDIRQAEAQLASSNFSVESARAAFFPQIQLTAPTGVQSAALASLFGPGAWYYTLAAGLTQPLFDGFLLESQLKQAKGVQLQNLQAYRKAVLSAFADVEKALVALAQFTRQERLQNDVVTASRKAFEVSETQYRGGTVNLLTVLQTQQTLLHRTRIRWCRCGCPNYSPPAACSRRWAAAGRRTASWIGATSAKLQRPMANAIKPDSSWRSLNVAAFGRWRWHGSRAGARRSSSPGLAGKAPLTFGMNAEQASQALGVP